MSTDDRALRRTVCWIHVTDLQLGFGKSADNDNDTSARRLIEQVASEEVDFVINSGDLIHGAHADQTLETIVEYWSDYQTTVKPLEGKSPILSAPGNHDMTREDRSMERYCLETGRADKPPYYAATIQGVHVICLNVVSALHRGGFPKGSEQEAWLKQELNRLPQARCLIAVGHYPIFLSPDFYGRFSDSSLHYDERTGQAGDLLPILLEAGVDLYLCGHLHTYERTRYGRLSQVMAGAYGVAYPDLMPYQPNQYCQALDERQCYVRYTLTEDSIHAEALSLQGTVVDAWSQTLNRGQ
jgi:DNA repair exonuclease SbcCD nuclease subunit